MLKSGVQRAVQKHLTFWFMTEEENLITGNIIQRDFDFVDLWLLFCFRMVMSLNNAVNGIIGRPPAFASLCEADSSFFFTTKSLQCTQQYSDVCY